MLEAAGVGGAGDSEVLAFPSPLQVPVWEPEGGQGEETGPESIRLPKESVCALNQRVFVRLGMCPQAADVLAAVVIFPGCLSILSPMSSSKDVAGNCSLT